MRKALVRESRTRVRAWKDLTQGSESAGTAPSGTTGEQRGEALGAAGTSDREAVFKTEPDLPEAVFAKFDKGSGLAGDQLGGGDVDRSRKVWGKHAVDPSGGQVRESDRQRADASEAVDRADQVLDDRQEGPGLCPFHPNQLQLRGRLDLELTAVQKCALAGVRRVFLPGSEVMDEAELDRRHVRRRGDRHGEAVVWQCPADVQRAVDRVDDDPGAPATVELHQATLLRDSGEGGTLAGQLFQLLKDDVLAQAVEDEGVVAALTDAVVMIASSDRRRLIKKHLLAFDDPSAYPEPVCGHCRV